MFRSVIFFFHFESKRDSPRDLTYLRSIHKQDFFLIYYFSILTNGNGTQISFEIITFRKLNELSMQDQEQFGQFFGVIVIVISYIG